jgi:mRNA interferase RelE/StbE
MSFTVVMSPYAARALRKCDPQARRRIQAAIELLAENPRPPNAVALVGGGYAWRVRTGDYRVVYEIYDHELIILVLAAGHRKEVYRS